MVYRLTVVHSFSHYVAPIPYAVFIFHILIFYEST